MYLYQSVIIAILEEKYSTKITENKIKIFFLVNKKKGKLFSKSVSLISLILDG